MTQREEIFQDWRHPVAEISGAGLQRSFKTSAADKGALARLLDINSCQDVSIDYELRPVGEKKFELTGQLSATLIQECVATLEPITMDISEELKYVFGSPRGDTSSKDDELSVFESNDIEPIIDGIIDVGGLAFEIISAGVDPYPRKPGADFEGYSGEPSTNDELSSPFAVLAELDQKEKKD